MFYKKSKVKYIIIASLVVLFGCVVYTNFQINSQTSINNQSKQVLEESVISRDVNNLLQVDTSNNLQNSELEVSKSELITSNNTSIEDRQVSDLASSSRTQLKFEFNNITAFFISSKSNVTDVKFSVENSQGKIYEFQNAQYADGVYGEVEASNESISKLYTFTDGIKSITIDSNRGDSPEIIPIESKIASQDLSKASKSSVTASYYKTIFQNAGINLITREEWGAPAESNWGPYKYPVNRIVVHHTATNINLVDPYASVRQIYNFHYYRCTNNSGSYSPTNPNPNCDEPSEWWEDIGYNYLIDPYGNIYEGRAGGMSVVGAHAPPNSGSVGIALIGNYQSTNPYASSTQALTKLISFLSNFYNFDLSWQTNLFGHRNINNTSCPGNILYSQIPNLINMNDSSTNVINARIKYKGIVDGIENSFLLNSEGYVTIPVSIDNVEPQIISYIRNYSDIISSGPKGQINGRLYLQVAPEFLTQAYMELSIVSPNLSPSIIYKIEKF